MSVKASPKKITQSASDIGPTLILDNGAYSMKAGLSTDSEPKIIPNCITKVKSERRRLFIGDQLEDCRDTSGLYYILPFQKGYMINGDVEKRIWDYLFGKDCLNIEPTESNILITEPQFNFAGIQNAVCELLFEEYEFKSVCRTTTAHMADFKYTMDHLDKSVCSLVIDSGYSFTYIVPFVNGMKAIPSIRRIDVGGKALTNYLKEVISYRQLHVLDETYLMNQVKEDLCFVSLDFKKDMLETKKKYPENKIIREYILPDYTSVKRGIIRPLEQMGTRLPQAEQQLMVVNNERFAIPELLFHPSDIGIKQAGLTETIFKIVEAFPQPMRPHFYKNIILCGGNALLPNFKERIQNELRACVDSDFEIEIHSPPNPLTYAWKGAQRFTQDPEFKNFLITKKMYNEKGIDAFENVAEI